MNSKLVVVLVFVFDLVAFGLAIAAEQRRSKGTVVPDAEKNYNYCVYDSDVATVLGVGALLFLLLSQIVVMVATKCFCCGSSRSGGSRVCVLLLFLTCWVTFIIAEACLLAGAVRNAYHTRYRTLFFIDPPSCETVRKGVFAAGAAFVFFTAIISEIYYLSYDKANDAGPVYSSAIGMSSYD